MDHADEQIFLLCVGKELHIPLATVVADHGKAGHLVLAAVVVCHPGKAPVHLEGFSRLRSETAAAVALGLHQLPSGGDQIAVCGDIVLDGSQSSGITLCLEPLQADLRVGHTLDEELVQNGGVARQHRLRGLAAKETVGLIREAILLEPAQLRPGDPGAPLQFGQIDLLQGEILSLFVLHFFDGLCYNIMQAITVFFFHATPFAGLLALSSIKGSERKR